MQSDKMSYMKLSQRVLCCFVALFLLLSLVAKPIKVNALAGTATVLIGAGSVVTPVGLGVAAAALLIALTGAAIVNSTDLSRQAESVYTSADPEFQAWLESTGQKLAEGEQTISFVIPQYVATAYNNNPNRPEKENDKYLPVSLPYVAMEAGLLTQLDSLNPSAVMSADITGLMAKGVSLLAGISLGIDAMSYNGQHQYQVMHDAFYTEIVQTRTALNNTINRTSSDIYSNITLVRNQITDQLIQTRNVLNNTLITLPGAIGSSVSDALSNLDDATLLQSSNLLQTFFPSLSSSSVGTSISTLDDVITDSFSQTDDDGEKKPIPLLPIWPFFNGRNNYFWQMFNDIPFMSGLQSFYAFVAALWVLFPLPIRYLIMFGFGVPVFVGLAKMFAG